jgi:HAD superfamily hydrolase (TIGR01459 family)
VPSLIEIAAPYEALIVDLWGVIHDGTALYPGVVETLAQLNTAGKPIVFLSNAPRVAAKAQANLDRFGIGRDLYAAIVTSGQVAHDLLIDDPEWFGTRYYYLGPSKDEEILADAKSYTRVADPKDADFILNTGYEYDFQPHEEVLPTLEKLLDLKLPLLCVNPDHEVVKIDGTRMLCAGTLADEYGDIGGEVTYIGKPFDDVYDRAFTLLSTDNVLAIGDNPRTDILGANALAIDSLLITGGVLETDHGPLDEAQARKLCAQFGATPTHVLPAFG